MLQNAWHSSSVNRWCELWCRWHTKQGDHAASTDNKYHHYRFITLIKLLNSTWFVNTGLINANNKRIATQTLKSWTLTVPSQLLHIAIVHNNENLLLMSIDLNTMYKVAAGVADPHCVEIRKSQRITKSIIKVGVWQLLVSKTFRRSFEMVLLKLASTVFCLIGVLFKNFPLLIPQAYAWADL